MTIGPQRTASPNRSIDWILESADGYLWLGTEGGHVRFERRAIHSFNLNTMAELPGTDSYPTVPLYADRLG